MTDPTPPTPPAPGPDPLNDPPRPPKPAKEDPPSNLPDITADVLADLKDWQEYRAEIGWVPKAKRPPKPDPPDLSKHSAKDCPAGPFCYLKHED